MTFGVQLGLDAIKEANARWAEAQAKYAADVEYVMKRLINEAALNFMSAEQIAQYSGYTVKRVRLLMRANNLNPKRGKRLLANQAAMNLTENAELLGVEVQDMDLMSPLAYLPLGSEMRKFLETPVTVEEVSAEVAEQDARAETRDLVAAAIYADGSHGDWLTTVDGSPNAVSYELADRVLAVLNPEEITQ